MSVEDAVAARCNLVRRLVGRRRECLTWGKFFFTYKAAGPSWQATCPYHRKNSTTGCRKTYGAGLVSVEDHCEAIQWLKAWCCNADQTEISVGIFGTNHPKRGYQLMQFWMLSHRQAPPTSP